MNAYNPEGKSIRFINSRYKDLFCIPDGGCIQIHYPEETVVKPCTYIDDYHTKIGHHVFHICEFAEIMERNGANYMAEPTIMGDEAAWRVGKDRILALQICEEGYDYTLCDLNYVELDGGKWETPELSMIEARTKILGAFNLGSLDLRAMVYEDVMEEVFEAGRQAVVVDDRIKAQVRTLEGPPAALETMIQKASSQKENSTKKRASPVKSSDLTL